MELRLFNRARSIRLVRPHRVAFFEWLRALRHNIFCEITLFIDTTKERFLAWKTGMKAIETGPSIEGAGLVDKARDLLSGRRAGEATRKFLTTLRVQGVQPSFWALIFAIGMIGGFILKAEAWQNITIGYDDYTLKPSAVLYDLNAVEKEFALKQAQPLSSDKQIYPGCSIE